MILYRLLHQQCILCGINVKELSGICHACSNDLPRPVHPCWRCSIELGPGAPADSQCGQCLLTPPVFDRCTALLRYEYPARELIGHFKFHAGFAEGKTLASLLAEQMSCAWSNSGKCWSKPELLIPIPLHSSRLRERGFNQSMETARIIGKYCNIRVEEKLCRRLRATPSQKGLSAAERFRNLRGAFALQERWRLDGISHAAIVDDVVTTMSTVNTVAELLLSAGLQRIDVLCLARVS